MVGICQESYEKIDNCQEYLSNGMCRRCKYGYYSKTDGECAAITINNCLELETDNSCWICNNKILAEKG